MKAVLANRIFLDVDGQTKTDLKEKLTYRIPARHQKDFPTVIRNVKNVKPNIVSIPSGATKHIPESYEIIDKRITKDVEFPEFKGTLRPTQQDIYDDVDSSCIINAKVSFGKTFTALAIAGKLKQKTLIVTHTVALRNQWQREIEKVYRFTPGIIGSGKFEVDTPIVISNVQTLNKKLSSVSKMFGLTVIDESHHCPSTTFTKILDSMWSKYKIGLTGTLQRKDGKHIIFRDYFGEKIIQPPTENSLSPEVYIHYSNFKLADGMQWAQRVNKLVYDKGYQKEISAITAAFAAKGHKVLLVADRVEFLENCAELIGENAVCITGNIKNDNEREELLSLVESGEKNVLAGTQSIFSEGISCNPLSCIVLATPINNEPLLEQLVGRIQRIHPDKLTPAVIDINLQGNTAKRQAKARLGFYMKQGWKIAT